MTPGRTRTKGSRGRLRIVVVASAVTSLLLIALLSNDSVAFKGFSASQKASVAVEKPVEPLEVRGTIFASIISYRDSDCSPTIAQLFHQADYPERIYAGVCEQNSELPGEPQDCSLAQLPVALRDHVGYSRMNASDAKGIPLARHLAASHFNGQDFFMQVDAHSTFSAGWDTTLVSMWQKTKKCSPKPVISNYPLDWGSEEVTRVPRICSGAFQPSGLFRFDGALEMTGVKDFVRVPYAAGGFMFFPGQVLSEMPIDPHLPYLFEGDEILFSVRLFTHGWDVYTPIKNVIWHRYKGTPKAKAEKRADVFSDHSDKFKWLQSEAHQKVKWLLGQSAIEPSAIVMKDINRYRLGKVRTLKDYENFALVDFKNQSTTSKEKFCESVLPPNSDLLCPGE